jgi:hypothetical protein
MAFGQNFLKGFTGEGGLRDYTHADKTFLSNGYALAPRSKYLFHVYFTINTAYIPALRSAFSDNQEIATIGLLVKNVQLPTYTLGVETMNQYNRKRLIQTKIDYQPVQFEFHDDGNDLIRGLWYSYYSYYYKDPSQKYDNLSPNNGNLGPLANTPNGFNYNARDIYDNSRAVNDWGYIGESYTDGKNNTSIGRAGKMPFFRDIRIYGLNQHQWNSYVLINPMITEWNHDQYDYSQGNGTMSHRMAIRYETVKYGTGAIGDVRPDTNVVGFGDPAYYDTTVSGITRPGMNATVLGQGGLLDTGIGIAEDLASGGVAGLVGAIQKSTAAYNTYKDKNLSAIANQEVKNGAQGILKASTPAAIRAVIGTSGQKGALDGIFFPTPPKGDSRAPAKNASDLLTEIARQQGFNR